MNSNPETIAEFWKWFSLHAHRLESADRPDSKALEELTFELRRIDQGLVWEIGPDSDKKYTLCVSADGFRERVECVFETIAMAPKIPNWSFVAFRQRTEPGFGFSIGNLKIECSNLRFELLSNDLIYIAVYVPNELDPNSEDVKRIAFITVDELLGEYDVITKVGCVKVLKIEDFHSSGSLLTAGELAIEFDRVWARMSGDPEPN